LETVRSGNHPAQRETYNVFWENSGCWQATENCVTAITSKVQVCPPSSPKTLTGCA
jgi:hypothetical protein